MKNMLFQDDDETDLDVIAYFDAIAENARSHPAATVVAESDEDTCVGPWWVYINDANGIEYGKGVFPSRYGGYPEWFDTYEEAMEYMNSLPD